MKRISTFSILSSVASAFLNSLQDRALGALPANLSGALANALAATAGLGRHGVSFVADTTLAAGTLAQLDDSIDWRDRLLTGELYAVSAGRQPGGASDYLLNDPTASAPMGRLFGYTGTGAYASTAATTAVSAGVPPVNGAAAVRSYAVHALTTDGTVWLYLYADPSTGVLYAYNNTAAAFVLAGTVFGSGALGLRP